MNTKKNYRQRTVEACERSLENGCVDGADLLLILNFHAIERDHYYYLKYGESSRAFFQLMTRRPW